MKFEKFLKVCSWVISMLLAISIGHSLLTQQLGVSSTLTIDPKLNGTDYHIVPYTRTRTGPIASLYKYSYNPIQIVYMGSDTGIINWEVIIALPPGSTLVTSEFVNCSYAYSSATGQLVIYNTAANGTVAAPTVPGGAGGTVSFSFAFTSTVSDYFLDIVSIKFYSATNPNPNLTSVTLPNSSPSVEFTQSVTKGLIYYYRDYTFKFTNTTANRFLSWRGIIQNLNTDVSITDVSGFTLVLTDSSTKMQIDGVNLEPGASVSGSFRLERWILPTFPTLSVQSFIGKSRLI